MNGRTKPCSAYCRPEEGIHVDVDYVMDEACIYAEGEYRNIISSGSDLTCVPPPGRVVILGVEKAPEAPPCEEPDVYPIAVLYTMRVAA